MIACSKLTVLACRRPIDLELVRRGEPADAATTVTLRCLASPARPPVSRLTTPSFQPRSFPMSIVRLAERRCRARPSPRFLDHLGGVQQRLGRDAADVQADPAELRPALHQHDLLAQIGGPEGGGVAARPRPSTSTSAWKSPAAATGGWRGCGAGVLPAAPLRGRPTRCRRAASASSSDHVALRDAVPHLDPDLSDGAALAAGTSIVALSDSSVISGSSTLIVAPGRTWTSMIGTSV